MAQHDCDTDPQPDECFRCKMRYIRDSGGLSLKWQGGSRNFFHESCIPERQRKKIAECRANGWEPRLKTAASDWKGW